MRHAILRTRFTQIDGRAVQIVARSGGIPYEESDLRSVAAERRQQEAARTCNAFAERPFALGDGPLVRAQVLALTNSEHIVQIVLHGLVADEQSLEVLWRELALLYRVEHAGERASIAPLPMQYADFAAWHREFVDGPALDAQRAYWSQRLANGIVPLRLPYDRKPSPAPSLRRDRVEMRLERGCMDEIARIAAEEGCRPAAVLLASYVAFLFRYGGDPAIAVGVPFSGRTLPESEPLIGPFANTAVLTAELDRRARFIDLVHVVAEREGEAYDHQDLPVEQLAGGNRIQTHFLARRRRRVSFTLPCATTARFASFGSTFRDDLTFELLDGHVPAIAARYDAARFDRATIDRMVANFATLVRGVAEDPERPLGALPVLAEAERKLVVETWNATEAPREGTQTLHGLFQRQVAVRPDAPAVVWGDRTLRYDELDRRANRMARALRDLGVERGSLVGICLERSIETIVTLLAVVKAGGAFVPLDPAYPDERLAMMLGDAAPRALITTEELAARFSASAQTTMTTVKALRDRSERLPDDAPAEIAQPDDAAYVIYTSGSTGIPKGVVVTHRSACNTLLSARTDFGMDQYDRVLQLASLSFDPSVWQIFGTLALGACIVLPTSSDNRDATSIARDIVAHRVTLLIAVPALLALLFDLPELREATHLRAVVSGGSTLTPALRDRCAAVLGVPLYNVYGPTEASIQVTSYRCDPSDEQDVIPIGRPIENARLYVLDEERRPVPIGVAGELFIGGGAVARGYLHRPELTAERFVLDPFAGVAGARMYRTGDLARYRSDGNIEFLGRVDEQVKVRGVRIELGEVEAAFKRHPNVALCAVVVQERDADSRLVAFIVLREPRGCDVAELRAHASTTLPPAEQPSIIEVLDALPELPNGKVDRRSLATRLVAEPVERAKPNEIADVGVPVAGIDTLIAFLIELWQDVLGVDRVGASDDFFSLGGHSLLAARVLARIEAAFGTRLPFSVFFAEPTIEGLARAIRSEERASFEEIVPVQIGGDRTPLFFLHGDYTGIGLYARRFAGALGAEQPIYAIPPHGADGGAVPATIEEMAADHLRRVRSVQPVGPYLLGGYCFGGLVALEMARQLRAQGEQVLHVVAVVTDGIRSRFGYVEDAAARIAERVGIPDAISRRWIASRREDARRWRRRLRPRSTRSQAAVVAPDPLTAHVDAAEHRALAAYAWRRVPVPVTMLCAQDDLEDGLLAVARNWSGLFETLDVRSIPGGHTSALTRHLSSLTAELADVLHRVGV
jgi:amino acid adenylation domain-containing protein